MANFPTEPIPPNGPPRSSRQQVPEIAETTVTENAAPVTGTTAALTGATMSAT